MYLVALLGEWEGINAGRPAHVKNYRGWGREVSSEDRLGAEAFQFTLRHGQPLGFLGLQIMRFDFFWYQSHWASDAERVS